MINQDSWPYQEAQKVLDRLQRQKKSIAVFECGFGPSGSPHIGTVAEMLRTKLVIDAFNEISTGLTPTGEASFYTVLWILFADDLDALRKVPKNIPEAKQLELEQYLGVAVCDIPDPYNTHKSYADYNIWQLAHSLSFFGLTEKDYRIFRSSTCYRNRDDSTGIFNDSIVKFARKAQEIKDIVTHDYKKERIANYCPFLPIAADGRTTMELYDWKLCTMPGDKKPSMLHYYTEQANDDRIAKMVSILDGHCKLQWKADWPLRWYAFDVDYEMHGKDLLGSAKVGDRIMKLMNREPPIHMMYELFLDEEGKKISKSDGTNDALHDWCHYTTPEVMMYFLSQNPRKARKLHFGLIPQMTDDYLKMSGENVSPISFSMLLNLVSITNTDDKNLVWGFIQNYIPDATLEKYPFLGILVGKAINYYETIVLPAKTYRTPTEEEITTLIALKDAVISCQGIEDDLEKKLTEAVYNVGKAYYGEKDLRNFFKMVYQVIMGQDTGPRLPIFIMLFGLENAIKILEEITNT